MMSGFESGDTSIRDDGSPMMRVLEKLPIGVALMNDTGDLLYRNPAFRDISDDPRFLAAFQKLTNGEQVNDLLSLTRADENDREVEHTYRLRGFHLDGSSDKNNGHSRSMMLVEDITESYRLKKNLSRAQRMESVGSMASAVAHDFNNILTVILQSVHLLKQNLPQDQAYLDPLDVIEGTTLSAGELAQQLLTLSKPRTSDGRDLDLNAVIKDALPILERVLHEGINLEFEFEEDLWSVHADPSQIMHILVNLCINAQEAMEGHGKINIATRKIDRSSLPKVEGGLGAGYYVLLSVSDEGPGIPPELTDRVFDPFFTTKEMGTGLGLSTAYTFAKEQGGTVTLYSEDGRGTRINLYLRAEPRPPAPQVEQSASPVDHELTGNETILLVDDEWLLLDLAREILSLQGYSIVTASSGEEAVETIISSEEQIPLVILDMAMPGMNGLETLRAIRAHDPDIRAIISSGFHASKKMREVVGAEVDAFVNKPYEIDHLVREVRRLLDSGPIMAG